jgi:hypothetical protein
MELDKRGADLLFQVLTEREEIASAAIASNESFGGWTKTFTAPRLCAAIVDRLTFNGAIIEHRLLPTRPHPRSTSRQQCLSTPYPATPGFHAARLAGQPDRPGRRGPEWSLADFAAQALAARLGAQKIYAKGVALAVGWRLGWWVAMTAVAMAFRRD